MMIYLVIQHQITKNSVTFVIFTVIILDEVYRIFYFLQRTIKYYLIQNKLMFKYKFKFNLTY